MKSVGLEVLRKMNKKQKRFAILLATIALTSLIMSACNNGTQELDIDAQKTGFAQTADAQASMTIAAQPTATATQETTSTPTPTEVSEIGTTTPTQTSTSEDMATATPINTRDEAIYREQDPADNTEFSPGETFTVTWKLENIGTSTWTMNYYILFTSGEQMNAEEKVYLPYPVPPGTNVLISVELTAPEEPGEYKSIWSLANSNDDIFYTNFYVVINVVTE